MLASWLSLLVLTFAIVVRSAPLLVLQDLQQQQQQEQLNTFANSDVVSNEDLFPESLVVRDLLQSHYESVIDSVLATHSEDLLTRLDYFTGDAVSASQLLKPAAIDLQLKGNSIKDSCLVAMPALIAQQVHHLNKAVFETAGVAIDQALALFWPEDMEVSLGTGATEHSVGILFHIQEFIVQELLDVVNEDDFTHRLRNGMKECQASQDTALDDLWMAWKRLWKKTEQEAFPADFLREHLRQVKKGLSFELINGFDAMISIMEDNLADKDEMNYN